MKKRIKMSKFADFDYKHRLDTKSHQWLNEFEDGFYNGDFRQDLIKVDQASKRDSWNAVKAYQRDALYGSKSLPETFLESNPSYPLADMIDAAKRRSRAKKESV